MLEKANGGRVIPLLINLPKFGLAVVPTSRGISSLENITHSSMEISYEEIRSADRPGLRAKYIQYK
jgi:hypothetical protein